MYRLGDIARMLEGELYGAADAEVKGLAALHEAGPAELSFVAEEKYVDDAKVSKAMALVVSKDFPEISKPLIRVLHPRLAWAKLLAAFAPPKEVPVGVHETAVIGEDVVLGHNVSIQAYAFIKARSRIGNNAVIYPGVYIGADVRIGDNTVIHANAVIQDRVQVGKNCIIHPGVVLGTDGFGFVTTANGHQKVEHIGTVIIEDDVEIGANTTIDRATTGVTLVARGTKIDNLVQVGHNSKIGPQCLITGLCGIAGSSVLEGRNTMGGQSGLAGHLTLGEGTVVAARGLVAKDTPPHSFVSGFPARPHKENMRIIAAEQRLPTLLKEFAQLKKELAQMQEREQDMRMRLLEMERRQERTARERKEDDM
ncbi:MAG TPA: UDP-3-O-(3-hydroxymyristoyl)glucosamine N-acyltransferase [Firmicutes bacterium]|nr:UDP-3-O-(3-hydroxymyristoyl)glucosamine N-acyltransferase [Bacillota bacterium]